MAEKETVKKLFDDIAPRYDLLNHLLSLNIDKSWRRRAVRELEAGQEELLDVACGTGDFAIAAVRAGVKRVTGIDISAGMVDIGKRKVEALGLSGRIALEIGDSEQMRFPDNTFDAVTVAFGVRNFEHLGQGLREMCRVLRPGGKIVILEFSMPDRFPMKQLYTLYFRRILPLFGGWISGNRGAYIYLPESVMRFPQGKAFLGIMECSGFVRTARRKLTGGIASLYTGEKPV